jgi:hypothetical protein
MTSFNRKILAWCKLHSDDPLSEYFLKSYNESSKKRRAERKRWSQMAEILVLVDIVKELEQKK